MSRPAVQSEEPQVAPQPETRADGPTSRFVPTFPPRRAIDYADEITLHDEWGDGTAAEQVHVRASFEAATAPEHRHILNWLGDVRGLRVLDLGCGCGEAAVYFALRGARVTAVDISRGMLALTQRVAQQHGVQVTTLQQNADLLDLPTGSFDVVYAGNLLHHVDLETTLQKATRVLKPDGRFVSWDPLRHNPLINVYRRMSRDVHSADECPLSMGDVRVFRKHFQHVERSCFWLTTLWIFLRFFLIERADPRRVRYWKKIITDAQRLTPLYRRLETLDRFLLRWAPWLGRYCWNMVICARGPIRHSADEQSTTPDIASPQLHSVAEARTV